MRIFPHRRWFWMVWMVGLAASLSVAEETLTPANHGELRAKAEQGDPEAEYHLGMMYYLGQSLKQDFEEAVRWYRRAAEQGHARAQLGLGMMYCMGQGVSQDYAEAYKWLDLSANQGLELALRSRKVVAGLMTPEQLEEGKLRSSRFVIVRKPKQPEEAKRSAAPETSEEIDREKSRTLENELKMVKLESQAAGGDSDANLRLGLMYANGQGVPRDYAKAADYIQRSSEVGNPLAQTILGGLYVIGRGVPQDYFKAYKWFALATTQSSEKESAEIRKLFARLIMPEQLAALASGRFTVASTNLFKDDFQQTEPSNAAFGRTAAATSLFLSDREKAGIYEEAVRSTLLSAEKGDALSQAIIGALYCVGYSVPQDYAEAYKWFDIAAGQKLTMAIKSRRIIAGVMSSEQIAEGKQRKIAFMASRKTKDSPEKQERSR